MQLTFHPNALIDQIHSHDDPATGEALPASAPFPTTGRALSAGNISRLVRMLDTLVISYRTVACADRRFRVQSLQFSPVSDYGFTTGVKVLVQLMGGGTPDRDHAALYEVTYETSGIETADLVPTGGSADHPEEITLEEQLVAFVGHVTDHLNQQLRADLDFWGLAFASPAD
ncbi:hypothetical protein [Gordonia sihwensis]|uniref:hypothetical protein n=1 Tax=Gordonia sihwensis TaxID=173559 RepID=UPI0005EF4B6B|nr:hypothetical protein [Gordonia sihwensis]KJR10533.1 hypothetical protein UG54_00620 [Gordonia sihwensis]